MKKLLQRFLDGFGSIEVAIYFRFDYNDNLDRCAFFEELNWGWYEMYIYPMDDMYIPTKSNIRRFWLEEK
jgi:hypothetical protein